MKRALIEKLFEAMRSVLPVAAVILVVSAVLTDNFSGKELVLFSLSTIMLVTGMALFNLGADLSMIPMGEYVGTGLARSGSLKVLGFAAFLMGMLITVAEPDLSVLAEQVSAVLNGRLLIFTVGAGVGIFLLLALFRIIFKTDLRLLIFFFYMLLFCLAAVLLEQNKAVFLPLTFDSGGVTTGPITVPFIMALGLGVAGVIGGRESRENSFGLIALCSVGPMLAVAILSLGVKGSLAYDLTDYQLKSSGFGSIAGKTAGEVALALGLIAAMFMILQFTILKLPLIVLKRIAIGLGFTYAGLVVFLSAVSAVYVPFGFRLGCGLIPAGRTVVVLFCFLIGALVVLAEPAVHVLNKQVEEVTGGEVSRRTMMTALSVGVGLSIGLSALRIYAGFSLLYYLIPGYLISLGLSFFVPRLYTAIAFDSGGVASGPLTSSFILPMAIGICHSVCGTNEVLRLGFGIVSMVAMTPLITIQLLGFKAVLGKKLRNHRVIRQMIDADDEQIINFSWKEAGDE